MSDGHHGIDDELLDVGAELFGGDFVIVLDGDNDRIDALRPAIHILDADLALTVGPQVGQFLRAARLTQALRTSLCASMMGSGISSSVSSQA